MLIAGAVVHQRLGLHGLLRRFKSIRIPSQRFRARRLRLRTVTEPRPPAHQRPPRIPIAHPRPVLHRIIVQLNVERPKTRARSFTARRMTFEISSSDSGSNRKIVDLLTSGC